MAVDAGIKLGVEGESTFKSAMSAVNQEIKTMAQEVKEAASGTQDFGSKQEALTKYIEANEQKLGLLTKQYESAKDKLKDLAQAMEEAKESGNEEAITKATNAYNKQATEVGKLEQQMSSCRTEINNSKSAMDEQTQSVEKGIEGWGELAAVVGQKTVEALKVAYQAVKEAVNAFVDLANETAETGDHIDKMSQKIGISAEAYQEWAYVCERSGTSVDVFQGSMKTLSSVISDAGKGSESAAEKLEAIGLCYDDLKDKSPDDQLKAVVSALQEMDAGADRTAAATDLLGRAATELGPILNMTADDTKALADEAHEYGMVMSDDAVKASAAFEDALTKVNGTLDGVKNAMMSEFLPGLTDIMNGFSDLVAGVDGGADKIKEGFGKVSEAFKKVLPALVDIVKEVITAIAEIAPDIIKSLLEGITSALPSLVQGAKEIIPGLVDGIIDSLPALIEAAVEILAALAKALIDNLPKLLEAIPRIIAAIIKAFTGADMSEIGQHIWDGVTKAFEKVGQWFSDRRKDIETAFSTIGDWFRSTFQKAQDVTKSIWQNVGSWFSDRRKDVEKAFSGIDKWMSQSAFAPAWEGVKKVWQVAGDYFKTIWEQIKNVFAVVESVLKGDFEGAWNGIKNIWNTAADFFRSVWEAIKGVFSGALETFANIGKSLIDGLKKGISNAWEGLKSWFMGLFDGLVGGVKKFFGIASPSKLMAQLGGYVIEGFADGIAGGKAGVNAAWQSAVAGVGNLAYSASGVGGGVTTVSGAAASGGAQPINLQIDGRTFARLTVPYIDQQQGFNWSRQMALGVS